MATRAELVGAIRERYQRSDKRGRSAILNEFMAVTGYHRKHAIRLVGSADEVRAAPMRRTARRYGAEVREGLIALWEASDPICSKRLKPLIPVHLRGLERHGQLAMKAHS